MKTFIKKVMVVLVVLAAVVDWPVEIDAGKGDAVVKVAKPLLKSCAKQSKNAEVEVNKATQEMKRLVNEAAENPNVQRGFAGSRAVQNATRSRAVQNATRSSAQTTSQPRMLTCPRCNGKGSVQANDGYVYSCSRCNGTGKIFTR